MFLIRVRAKLCRSGPDLRMPGLNKDTHMPCSLQSPHSKGIGMITAIWNLPVNRLIHGTRTVTPLINKQMLLHN